MQKKKGVTRKNFRSKSLKNIQNKATNKEYFRIVGTRKVYPGQLVRLYANTLANNFPGQVLKEFEPAEYVKQMKKLKVKQALNAERATALRGPGSRGSRGSRGSNYARLAAAVAKLEAAAAKNKD